MHQRKLPPSPPPCILPAKLQWGRWFTPAETRLKPEHRAELKRLQWGRWFTPAETLFGLVQKPINGRASMGPLVYTSGNPSARSGRGSGCSRFNGAAGLHQRKPGGREDCGKGVECASMGPLVYTSGNLNFSPPEDRVSTASMGPLVYTSGNLLDSQAVHDAGRASMGPLVYTSGNQ